MSLTSGVKAVSIGPDGQRLDHHPELSPRERERRFGRVEVGPTWPTVVVAGDPVSFSATFRSRDAGLVPGAQFAVMWRLPADWGTPQFDDPSLANYLTFESHGTLDEWRPSFGHRAGVPPWSHCLVLTFVGAATDAPTWLTIHFGGVGQGSPGWQSPTAALPDQSFVFATRSAPSDAWNRLATPPSFRIAAGSATDVEVTGPSTATVGSTVRLIVRGVDAWGNVSRGSRTPPVVDSKSFDTHAIRRVPWDADDQHDLWHVVGAFVLPGTHRPCITFDRWCATANPVVVTAEERSTELVWGDVHGGQGELGVGQGSLDRYFAFADLVAGLQFTSHQANDVYVTQADWHHTREVTDRRHRDGSFVTLLGCEWTASVDDGGDHNVVYRHDQPMLRRARRWFLDEDDWPDAPTPPDLYEHLAGREALLNVHVGGFTSDLRFHDPRLQRMVEIHSTHATSRWFVFEALALGYEMGIVGSSDGISGRPGACRPGRRQNRNVRNGVTGAYVDSLTRDGVWSALRRREVYATTGERIILRVDAGGQPMGTSWTSKDVPPIDVYVEGTAAIERIVLRCGSTVVEERMLAPKDPRSPTALRVSWQGSRERGAARHQRQDWTGSLTLSEGTMDLLSTVRFEPLTDRVVVSSPRRIDLSTVTAGNEIGVVVDVRAPDDATLSLATSCGTWAWAVRDLRAGVRVDVPNLLDGRVSVAPPPDPSASCSARVTFQAPHEEQGHHAYWVEVVQVDGARAWSSPCFVHVEAS